MLYTTCKKCGVSYLSGSHICLMQIELPEPIYMERGLRPLLGPGKMNGEEWARWGCRPPHWTDPIVRPIMECMNPPLKWR